ncbi:uncharacterized protein LODBEIA_P56030 [Lodderomyces beijingensis]|uniref:Sm protein F n=1 Tax=Lodderomyces beijingensis TaxID=1775926 RepID=A0ABP0ZTB2_9ASCO
MSSFHPVNPKPFIKSLLGKQVVVRLKWNKTEYRGKFISADNYLNIQLDDTFEIIYEKSATSRETRREEMIGNIFIRCNNVLFIREWSESENEPSTTAVVEKQDVEMAEESNGTEDVVAATSESVVVAVEEEKEEGESAANGDSEVKDAIEEDDTEGTSNNANAEAEAETEEKSIEEPGESKTTGDETASIEITGKDEEGVMKD